MRSEAIMNENIGRRIRVVFVDDEVLARRFIKRLLGDDPEVEIVAECTHGRDAVTLIREERPDLVFLDVQMPEMDGFAVLEELGAEVIPKIVFTTAYQQYAIRAFEVHAIDYLLKPFDQLRFSEMLRHAKKEILTSGSAHQQQLEMLIETVKQGSQYVERFVIKNDGRFSFVKVADITWVEADDKYVRLHVGKGTRIVRQTLVSIEAQLDPKRFSRIHRSAIVNIDRIRELSGLFNGEYEVVMEDGTKLIVSRHYKEKFFRVLGKPL